MTDIVSRMPMIQTAPYPYDLVQAVEELEYLLGWRIWIAEEDVGQDVSGLALSIVPNNRDSYHPERHVNTRFTYLVPAAAFNRESWEEWLWDRIRETEDHERAENFKFIDKEGNVRRPFKPAHGDGWNPNYVRRVIDSSTVNTPNTGRLVLFPCKSCGHQHRGKMGEHFTIESDKGCTQAECACGKQVGARDATEETGQAKVSIDDLVFVVAPGKYAGLDIRHFMHPPLSTDYNLYEFTDDGNDPIGPTDIIDIQEEAWFNTERK